METFVANFGSRFPFSTLFFCLMPAIAVPDLVAWAIWARWWRSWNPGVDPAELTVSARGGSHWGWNHLPFRVRLAELSASVGVKAVTLVLQLLNLWASTVLFALSATARGWSVVIAGRNLWAGSRATIPSSASMGRHRRPHRSRSPRWQRDPAPAASSASRQPRPLPDSHRAVVRDLVDQRESAVRGRPILEVPGVSPASSFTPQARQVITTGLARDALRTVAPALTDPHAREQVRKQAKIQELFQFVVEHLVDLRELGLSPSDAEDPAQMQLFKDNLMQSAQRLGLERLGALLSAVRRWRRYAQCYQVSINAPTPLQVSQFLQQVGSGGPTAAASVYQVLRWFSDNFGCHFHLEHFLVKPYRLHGQAHTGEQAKELQPWEILNWSS